MTHPERPNPHREDLGYDIPPRPMTLDDAETLHAQGLGGKQAARLAARAQSIREDDLRYHSDSHAPKLTDEEVERAHRYTRNWREIAKQAAQDPSDEEAN